MLGVASYSRRAVRLASGLARDGRGRKRDDEAGRLPERVRRLGCLGSGRRRGGVTVGLVAVAAVRACPVAAAERGLGELRLGERQRPAGVARRLLARLLLLEQHLLAR